MSGERYRLTWASIIAIRSKVVFRKWNERKSKLISFEEKFEQKLPKLLFFQEKAMHFFCFYKYFLHYLMDDSLNTNYTEKQNCNKS